MCLHPVRHKTRAAAARLGALSEVRDTARVDGMKGVNRRGEEEAEGQAVLERFDGYCRWLASYFFASGHDWEDLYQEARLAVWRAQPGYERVAARRQMLDLVKVANRRAFICLSSETIRNVPAPDDLFGAVCIRDQLRRIVTFPYTPKQAQAVGRRLRDEPIPYADKPVQQSLLRARRRLAEMP